MAVSATGGASELNFEQVSFSSTGDPHIRLSGTTESGDKVQARYDDQHDIKNLASSDSFEGGVNVSAQTTDVNKKGVAFNKEVAIYDDKGRNKVIIDKDGSLHVTSDGKDVTVKPGGSADLGDGETVSVDSKGVVHVELKNDDGGDLKINVARTKSGLDVTATGKDIELGGAAVHHAKDKDNKPVAFESVSASSTGDPHLAISGTTEKGAEVAAKFSDQHSHADLVSSTSIKGGFNVATHTTPLNAHGVAFNQSATITVDNGNDTVEVSNNGAINVSDEGKSIGLIIGKAVDLGSGASVEETKKGVVQVKGFGAHGAELSATLAVAGKGVNVYISGQDVKLSGFLVNQSA